LYHHDIKPTDDDDDDDEAQGNSSAAKEEGQADASTNVIKTNQPIEQPQLNMENHTGKRIIKPIF
jgi:hypothetical protein